MERENLLMKEALIKIRNQTQEQVLWPDAGIRCMDIARKVLNEIGE